jgi:hypothetical protein
VASAVHRPSVDPRTVILFYNRGTGHSETSSTNYQLSALASDVVCILDDLGPEYGPIAVKVS